MTAITILPADKIKANDYNPNGMSREAFAELVAEVLHLGRLPKPVIVRPNGDGYVIVDGEHGWRAARESGMQEVPCEIVEIDDFEARRQTFKRNQHGEHCPLRLGQMFLQMMEQRDLSQRALAKEIEVSEGTIRNTLIYAHAADLRNCYAPERGAPEIPKLSIRQVRVYVELPEGIRDPWLDNGADIDKLWKLAQCDDKGQRFAVERPEEWGVLVEAGLHEPLTHYAFDYAHDLWLIWNWRNSMLRNAPWIDDYIRPMIDNGLKAEIVKRLIPVQRDDSGAWQPAVSSERWVEIIADAATRHDKAGASIDGIIHAHVRRERRALGLDHDYSDPRVIEAVEAIEAGPDYLKDADLALTDKLTILNADADIDAETLDLAKRQAVEMLEAKENTLTKLESGEIPVNPGQAALLGAKWAEVTATSAFESALQKAVLDQRYKCRNTLFSDRTALTEKVMEKMRALYRVREGTINDEPVEHIMRNRFDALPQAEFNLLAAYILGEEMAGLSFWANGLGVEIKTPR